MSLGSVGRIRHISAWSRLATSISLLPGSGQWPMYTASLSLNLVMKSASSAPSSTRATSDSRTIAPLRSATTRFLNSSGAQIGVGKQVDLHQVALGLPHGGEVVVALQRRVHVAGREI